MNSDMKPSMQRHLQRRAFIAASALTIPSIALARTSGSSQPGGMEFEDLMKQAGKNLKSMRRPMQTLDNDASRDEAAFLANQVTILLAQSIEAAEQAPIPERSAAKYAGDKVKFARDLRAKLTEAVGSANELCRALLLGEKDAAAAHYDALRTVRKEGHDEFEEEH